MPEERPFQWVAEWRPRRGRDPVAVLDRAAKGRDPARVAERKDEMTADKLAAFFRGAAGVMADDLGAERAHTTELTVDVNGDAHLENFGMYCSPERVRVFDLNDFDEARPGPWEWDVCRLVASAVIIERDHDAGKAAEFKSARNAAEAYAAAAEKLAVGKLINRWYRMTRCDGIRPADVGLDAQSTDATPSIERVKTMLEEQEDRSQEGTVEALIRDGEFLDVDDVEPVSAQEAELVRGAFDAYRATIMPGLQRLVDGYTPTAVASRASGMGSLGLRNYLLLICGTTENDALILQVKEATPSQLDPVLGSLIAMPEGRRVVELQRVMQGASDPLLGWVTIAGQDYYVRQFRDMKATPKIAKDKLTHEDRVTYARLCGTVLARAHARTSQNTSIGQISAAIENDRDAFAGALVSFGRMYADVSTADQELYRDQR
jgi:uncharacterized protein (DUF2252 family)